MDREINIDSIRALEEQIGEHERAIFRLKRTRNSLLNVSRIPAEVLGDIFRQNVSLKGNFSKLDKRSHNFLLVCHHWFEVASSTPEVWSFWGNTLEDWARRCRHSKTSPLDLVLDTYEYGRFDTTLLDVLRDRATRDTIRRVHLTARNPGLLNSIIAQLTPNPEELRPNSIQSFMLKNSGDTLVDLSDFFTRRHFPKLQHLHLFGCTISSWDSLTSRTSILTTLDLHFGHRATPTPPTSQLLSILASNPALRTVRLTMSAVPDDGGKPSSQVQLRYLEQLELAGDSQHALGILQQLDYPRNIDSLTLGLQHCDLVDISQIIGPYLREHLRRRGSPQNGLELYVYYASGTLGSGITLRVGGTGEINYSHPASREFVEISVNFDGILGGGVLGRAALDLLTYTPREEIAHFWSRHDSPLAIEDTHAQFPNVRVLSFYRVPLAVALPNPGLVGGGEIFPCLECVMLYYMAVDDGDWGPLTNFLAHRVFFGKRLDTLVIEGSHMCVEVMKGVRDMVRELKSDPQSPRCPFGTCPKP